MSKELAESILRLKNDSSKINKTEFVTRLISDKFFVPVIAEADENNSITKMSYFSVADDKGSFLLVFTSVEAIGAWRKNVQFLELSYNDICSLINIDDANYVGVEIDHCGNSMALNKEFINRIKSHIKDKK